MDLFDLIPIEGAPTYQTPYVSEDRGTLEDLFSGLIRGTASTTKLMGQGLQQIGAEGIGSYVRKAGEDLAASDLAKPDEFEYRGLDDGRVKKIAMGVAENAPFVAGTILSGVGGTIAAGPVGGFAAGGSFLGLTAGAGTYKATIEELDQKRPDLSLDDKHRIALTESAIEFGTEGIGSLVSFGAGKLFASSLTKPVLKAGLRSMVESGEITTSQLIASTIGKTSLKDLTKTLTVAGVGEGTSEVAAQLLSAANREAAGLDNEPADLFNVFASAAILGGAMGGVGYKSSATNTKRMRESINFGLSSEDPEIRAATVQSLTTRLEKLDPEAAAAFVQTIGNSAIAGPVDLEQTFKIQREYPGGSILSASQVNVQSLEKSGDINKIVKDPGAILESKGVPSGVAPETFTTNPLGSAEFINQEIPVEKPYTPEREVPASVSPGEASYQKPIGPSLMGGVIQKTNQLAKEPESPKTLAQIKTQKDALLAKAEQSQSSKGTSPGTATSLQEQDSYAMSQAMAQVDPDSNNVILKPVESRYDTLKAKLDSGKKLTLKEKRELKTLTKSTTSKSLESLPKQIQDFPKVGELGDISFGTESAGLAERFAAAAQSKVEKPIESTKPEDNTDSIYTQDDLKGLKVELQGYNPKTKKVEMYKRDAYSAINDVDEEIELYKDIMRCVKRS